MNTDKEREKYITYMRNGKLNSMDMSHAALCDELDKANEALRIAVEAHSEIVEESKLYNSPLKYADLYTDGISMAWNDAGAISDAALNKIKEASYEATNTVGPETQNPGETKHSGR